MTDTPDTQNAGFGKMKAQSLKAAGYGYLIGDAAIIAAGLTDPSKKTWGDKARHALVGGYWALGGLAAARYGSPDAEKELKLLSRRLDNFLQKRNVKIPTTITAHELSKHGGLVSAIEDFLYQHPSQTLNAIYALGAGQLIYSGIKDLHGAKNKDALKLARFDTSSGILIAAGALAGLLIKEKQPDASHPSHSAWQKALSWVQEKPLRVSGLLYTVNNASMVGAAFYKRKANPESKNYLWRVLTATSYIFANTMLGLSSKKSGSSTSEAEDTKTLETLAQRAADIIAAQPKELQEALITDIAGYLSTQPEVEKKPDEITELLHAKLAGVGAGVPADPISWQQRVTQSPAASLQSPA